MRKRNSDGCGPTCRLAAVLAIFLVSPGALLHGQATPETMPKRGIVPVGSYSISDIEAINVVNGNVTYNIPLASLPAGRAGSKAGISLVYNSQVYDLDLKYGPSQVSPGTQTLFQYLQNSQYGGWRYAYAYSLDLEIRPNPSSSWNCDGTPDNWKIIKLSLISPDGSHHTLHLYKDTPSYYPRQPNKIGAAFWDDYGDGYYEIYPDGTAPVDCIQTLAATAGQDLTYHTTDGSFYKLVFSRAGGVGWYNHPWTLYLPDGRTATGYGLQMTSMSDANGNAISVLNTVSTTNPARNINTALSDSLGHTVSITYSPDSLTSPQDTITQTGYSEEGTPRTLTWVVNWMDVSLRGSMLAYQASGLGDTCSAGDGSYGCPILSQRAVSSLVLPVPEDNSQQTYTFGYDDNTVPGWGELNSITLPSGARVQYHYSQEGWNKPTAYTTENPVSQKILTWSDETASPASSRTETWTYTFYAGYSQTHNPDGGSVINTFYAPHILSNPLAGQVFLTRQDDGSTVERLWAQNRPYGSQGINPANPYVADEFHSVATTGSPAKASIGLSKYDKNGNRRQIKEYDWISYGDLSHDSYGAPNGLKISWPAAVRTTENAYTVTTNLAGSGSETIADDTGAYWHPGSPDVRDLLSSSSTTGVGPSSQSRYDYPDSYNHPNVKQEQHWDSQTSSWLTTSYSYDTYGNTTSITSPRSFRTTFQYDATNCMTQKVQGLSCAAESCSTTADTRTYTYSCEPNLGLATSQTDSDHGITRTFEYDRFGRITKSVDGSGGLSRQRNTSYYDQDRKIVEHSDLISPGDNVLTQTTWFDQLGRVRQAQDAGGSLVQTRYYTPQPGCLQSYRLVSNPYISTDTISGWTRTTFDSVGRVFETQHFSGSALPPNWGGTTCPSGAEQNGTGTVTTSYSSNAVATTDEAGVPQTSYTDGLGRLIQVTENNILTPTNQPAITSYGYDALNNLVNVTPASGNGRTFSYSSLGRLTLANNPESGATTYTYDANGNVATRTMGAITTSYSYNGLDQTTGRRYTDATPPVTYTYNKGWLTSVSSSASLYQYTVFDDLGRAIKTSQTTADQPAYLLQYTYNLADQITSITLPSTRVITTTYDNAGRPSTVIGVLGGTTNAYVNSASYAAHGAPQQINFNNSGLIEQACYNARLQTTAIRRRQAATSSCNPADNGDIAYVSYTFSASSNNGNILGQTIQYGASASGSYPSKTIQQTYNYTDPRTAKPVNRLMSADEPGGWSQGFEYDLVGNRWLTPNSDTMEPFTPTSNVYDGNNHQSGVAYDDGRGNVTQIGGYTYQYDAENHLISSILAMPGMTITSATYAYDGDGRRVAKQSGGLTTIYVYDVQGELAAEYAVGGAAPALPCTTCYVMADHLGSTRMLTDGSGNQKALYDYAPFGEELKAQNGRDDRWGGAGYGLHFTAKEQEDTEGEYMHYFGARYYSAGQGRFTSPDPIVGWPNDPQRWNMYAYARNNPLRYVDPDGQDYYEICGVNGKDCGNYTEDQYEKLRKDKSFIIANGKVYSRNKNGTQGDQLGTVARVETGMDDQGDAVVGGLAARADASNKLIGIVAGASVTVGVAGGAIVSGAVGAAVQTTLVLGANIGARLLPIGMATAYFGQQVMRWGTGNAQALARMGTITLQELQTAGITRQMAVSWQQFYSYVAQMNPANPSAAGRAELMQFVVNLFDKAK